jgi:pectin methylesterase-like acyl-CoA thioesterase
VPTKISTLCLILAFGFSLNGCSSMSAQARRERAYRHYVQKQMKHRQREMARAQKAANRQLKQKLKNVQPSDPQVTTSLEDVSPAPFSEPAPPPMAPVSSQADAVVAPVTVSASDAINAQNPEQPSRP